MTMQWYVLRSKPNKEQALWRELAARGYESFYPHLQLRPVDPRSRKIQPYFPGYMFVQLHRDQVGTSVLYWIPFSAGLVAFDETPATVPESMIHAIRRHVDQINAAGVQQLASLKPGDTVLIQSGPFDGYEAIFDARLAGTERVHVFLKMLQNRYMHLDLLAEHIQVKPRR